MLPNASGLCITLGEKIVRAKNDMMRAVDGGHRRPGLFLACMLAVASSAVPAHAQWIGSPGGDAGVLMTPAPQGAPNDMNMGGGLSSPDAMPGMTPRPQTGGVDCQGDINALRDDLESRGKKLEAGVKKKVGASELCPLFRSFVTAQEKFFGYLTKNQTNCGVPPDILKKMKSNTANVTNSRDRVCKAAAMGDSGGPAGPPPQGQLSSGLNLPSGIPSVQHTQPGGVFDTLGGNALR